MIKKRFLSIILTLTMLLGTLSGMSLTAYAADTSTPITPENPSGTMTITLIIAASSVKTAPVPNTLTYTGSAQELVTAGEADGGTMQYALGTATEVTGDFAEAIPAAADEGTYYVWYKVKGDGTHIDTDPAGPVIVTISEAKGDYSVKSTQGTEHVLGEDKDAVYTVTNSADDKRPYERFAAVSVDGKDVAGENYTKASGSLVLTLKSAYLNTLSAGEKPVKISFEDGAVDASLKIVTPSPTPTPTPTPSPTPTPTPTLSPTPTPTVTPTATSTVTPTVTPTVTVTPTAAPAPTEAPTATPTAKPVPKTGDQGHPGLWLALMLIGLAALAVLTTWMAARKRR